MNALHSRGAACLLAMMMTIAACGGDSDNGPLASGDEPPAVGGTEIVEAHISGSVGDGPIVGADITIRSRTGALLMKLSSSSTADYDLDIKTQGRNYPLAITADGGIDLVTGGPPDFRLDSGLLSPARWATVNLNPYTTLIFGAARLNGGVSSSSVEAATAAIMTHYGFGLDSALVPDPTTSPIDGSNVHSMVKSSETLGEMIRRTRDAMAATGSTLSGDRIVAILSADLVDGYIDGSGAVASDSRVAAVATIASAAVLVEAMANRLHVYGVDATQAMDTTIRQIRPNAPTSATTANVGIPAEAFAQAERALRAAALISSDPRIGEAIQVMASATPGSLPAAIAAQLPAGIDSVLSSAVLSTAYAGQAQLDAVNNVSRGGTGTGPSPGEPPPEEPPPEEPPSEGPPSPNQAPVISGSPDTALVVGTPWSFTPTASDPDGDALTFSVANKPGWLSFSTSTGKLSGTPSSAHVGLHKDITISVSDGQATASLGPFSLTVNETQPTTGSAKVSWTPPTERTDGTTISGISGYKIYYGKSPTQLDQVVNLGSGLTSYMIENLDSGTWYFAVTATDTGGLESAKSSIASKTIS